MITKKSILSILALVAVLAVEAQAGLFKDFRYGMGYAGFQQQTVRNVLGDGWDYNFAQTFNNRRYNYGTGNLTLVSGTLNGTASITHRGVPAVELLLNTPAPIVYNFTQYVGTEKYTITDGTFSINSDIRFDEFGNYNVQLLVNNRGTLVSNNPDKAPIPLDYTVGPIDIQGQWVIDLINLTVGKQFGFELPGGAIDQIQAALNTAMTDAINQQVAAYAAQDQGQDQAAKAFASTTMTVVPEPATLLLLGVGFAAMLRRRRGAAPR